MQKILAWQSLLTARSWKINILRFKSITQNNAFFIFYAAVNNADADILSRKYFIQIAQSMAKTTKNHNFIVLHRLLVFNGFYEFFDFGTRKSTNSKKFYVAVGNFKVFDKNFCRGFTQKAGNGNPRQKA